jgi:cell division protein FtsL
MATVAVTLPKLRRHPINAPAAGRARFPEIYYTKQIDNSRLVRQAALGKWREYFKLVALVMLAFVLGLIFSWQHLQCVQDGYAIQGLKKEFARQQEWNHQLRLSHAKLADPQRIGALAVSLGMVSPNPKQVIQWSEASERAQ